MEKFKLRMIGYVSVANMDTNETLADLRVVNTCIGSKEDFDLLKAQALHDAELMKNKIQRLEV